MMMCDGNIKILRSHVVSNVVEEMVWSPAATGQVHE